MVHFFVALLYATPAYVGWDTTVQLVRHPSGDCDVQYDYTVEDADGTQTTYRTLELLSKSDGDSTKHLRVWKTVELHEGSPVGDAVVLKDMWRCKEIPQEGSNMRAIVEPDTQPTSSDGAQKILQRGVLTVLHHGDVIIRPDPSKPEVSSKDMVPAHFNVYGSSIPQGRNILTGRRVNQFFWTRPGEFSQKRIHYRMVVKELCTPLYEIRWEHDKVFRALAEVCECTSARVNLLVQPRLTGISSFRLAVLRHLHQHGWVHHDISIGNILLDHDGQARLADFEFAEKYADQEKSHRIVRLSYAHRMLTCVSHLVDPQLAGHSVYHPVRDTSTAIPV